MAFSQEFSEVEADYHGNRQGDKKAYEVADEGDFSAHVVLFDGKGDDPDHHEGGGEGGQNYVGDPLLQQQAAEGKGDEPGHQADRTEQGRSAGGKGQVIAAEVTHTHLARQGGEDKCHYREHGKEGRQ